MKIAQVLPLLPFNKVFDYTIPDGMEVAVGDVAEIEFGKQVAFGFVTKIIDFSSSDPEKLKEIKSVILPKIITPKCLQLIKFAATYNVGALGAFAKLVFPFSRTINLSGFDKRKTDVFYAISNETFDKKSKSLEKILERYRDSIDLIPKDDILQIITKPTLVRLIEKGYLTEKSVEVNESAEQVSRIVSSELPKLSDGQVAAYNEIYGEIGSDKNVFLLDGETGSGKTEVYFHLIQTLVRQDSSAQILVMLPEISLANTIADRFYKRFGYRASVWHSSISDGIRQGQFARIISGDEKVVIGTRSALFLPYKNLKMIVADEEHDGSYKQEEMTMYHARNMAISRAAIEKIPIILGSATPAVESMANVYSGKYTGVVLKNRFFAKHLPNIEIVDLKLNKVQKGRAICTLAQNQIQKCLDQRQQVMIFINRRGYAPVVVCKACGFRIKCKHCDVFLTEHKFDDKLKCHQCGYVAQKPEACKACNSKEEHGTIGVGVEKIYEEIKKCFPDAKIALLSSDLLTSQRQSQQMISDITKGAYDIIIGTQIVAKGYHFPLLKFVCVVDADFGMGAEDFRCYEKTFQLLVQVAGRSGREGEEPGIVMLQTYEPDNKVLKAIASYDKDEFYKAEVENRIRYGLPPFSKQVSIIASSIHKENAIQYSRVLAQNLHKIKILQVFGPSPALITKIRGKYRFRLLVCCQKKDGIENIISKLLEVAKCPSNVSIKIDVDPLNFY